VGNEMCTFLKHCHIRYLFSLWQRSNFPSKHSSETSKG